MPSEFEREQEITRLIKRDFGFDEHGISSLSMEVKVSDSTRSIHVRVRYTVKPDYSDEYYRNKRCATLISQCGNGYLFGNDSHDVYFETPEMYHVIYQCTYVKMIKIYNKYTGLD